MKEGQNGNALLQEESMVEAYDKWRRWADEKVFKIITLLTVYDGDKVNSVDVDDGLDYHKNGREGDQNDQTFGC